MELLFFVGLVIGTLSDQIVAFGEIPSTTGIKLWVVGDKVDGQIPFSDIAQGMGMVGDPLNGLVAVGAMGVTKDHIPDTIVNKDLVKFLAAQKGVEGGKFGMGHGEVLMRNKVHGHNESAGIQVLEQVFQSS